MVSVAACGVGKYTADYQMSKDRRMRITWPPYQMTKNLATEGLDYERQCGEDAYTILPIVEELEQEGQQPPTHQIKFTSPTKAEGLILGVADGVGGWADMGVDPGIVSHAMLHLMSVFTKAPQVLSAFRTNMSTNTESNNSSSIIQTLRDVIAASHDYLQQTSEEYPDQGLVGSTTVCLAGLDLSAQAPLLHGLNIGDSGFVVVNRQGIAFEMKTFTHGEAPGQLAVVPEKYRSPGLCMDHADDAVTEVIPLNHNDIVVMGSDGLFDNIPSQDIAKCVNTALSQPVPAAKQMSYVAFQLMKLAQQGPKLDDITVICAQLRFKTPPQ